MRKLLVLLLFIGLISCEKQKIENTDCEVFLFGLSTLDESTLKSEVEKLTADLNPHPTDEDLLGHSGNLLTLVDRLNEQCEGFTASLLCYACRYSYPAQSEILIAFAVDGIQQEVTISIHTPENDILRFAGVQ